MCGIAVAVVAARASFSRPADAAPDRPVISGSTAIFTGDQHLGISSQSDFSTQSIDTLNVTGLTQDIAAPLPAAAGIFMSCTAGNGKDGSDHNNGGAGGAGKRLAITYDGGAYLLKNAGYGQYEALLLSSTGGNGNYAGLGDATKDGGGGGAGGDVSVTNQGGITTSGSDSNGIMAASLGGAGGNGGEANGVSGKGGAAKQSGKGGAVTVGNSGALQTTGDYSRGIFAQSVGGFGAASAAPVPAG